MNKLLLLLSLVVGTAGADNLISIEQVGTGNSNTVSVTVDGSDNKIDYSFGGASNSVSIDQKGDDAYVGYTTAWGSGAGWGGDLDGDGNQMDIRQLCNQSSCEGDSFQFHIQGDDNSIAVGQGYHVTTGVGFSNDSLEFGGHTAILDVHGSDNNVIISQRSGGDNHSNTTYVYGDNNSVYTRQEYNGDKSIDLTVSSDNNSVSLIQGGSGTHSATVSLSGTYDTDLNLTQYSNTAQTYSLSQSCATVGGCSVSVTQN